MFTTRDVNFLAKNNAGTKLVRRSTEVGSCDVNLPAKFNGKMNGRTDTILGLKGSVKDHSRLHKETISSTAERIFHGPSCGGLKFRSCFAATPYTYTMVPHLSDHPSSGEANPRTRSFGRRRTLIKYLRRRGSIWDAFNEGVSLQSLY